MEQCKQVPEYVEHNLMDIVLLDQKGKTLKPSKKTRQGEAGEFPMVPDKMVCLLDWVFQCIAKHP